MRLLGKRAPRLVATFHGIGNAVVICGSKEPVVKKSEIVEGTAGGWLEVEQRGGRLTVRTSDLIGLWVED